MSESKPVDLDVLEKEFAFMASAADARAEEYGREPFDRKPFKDAFAELRACRAEIDRLKNFEAMVALAQAGDCSIVTKAYLTQLETQLDAARRVVETAQDNEAALAAVLDRLRHNGWEGLRVSLVAWQKRLRAALADYDRLSKP